MKSVVQLLRSPAAGFALPFLNLLVIQLMASVTFAALLFGLTEFTAAETWSWIVWVAIAPILYVAWLVLFMLASALDVQLCRRTLCREKPTRLSAADGLLSFLQLHQFMFWYLRARFLLSLPLVNAFLAVEGMRHLVFLAYAPRTQLGRNSMALGYLFDPDLTELGDGAIVGGCTSIVAHSLTCDPNGHLLYVTSPIFIGPRAVVGGDARVDAGVTIGADALVEPGSYVAAFTQIGEGEVWGGHPARFLRYRYARDDQKPESSGIVGTSHQDQSIDQVLRQIVAGELHRPFESIPVDLHARDCPAWDSLAQLGISLALQQRFGITLTQQEAFRLRSMHDLREIVKRAGVS